MHDPLHRAQVGGGWANETVHDADEEFLLWLTAGVYRRRLELDCFPVVDFAYALRKIVPGLMAVKPFVHERN